MQTKQQKGHRQIRNIFIKKEEYDYYYSPELDEQDNLFLLEIVEEKQSGN